MTKPVSIIGHPSDERADVDKELRALRTLDSVYALIADGRLFEADVFTDALGNGSNFDLVLTTPADRDVYAKFHVSANGAVTADLYEGVSFSGGNPVNFHNRNRRVKGAPSTTAVLSPTVNSEGVTLSEDIIGNSNGGQWTMGGDLPGLEFFVLDRDTDYLFRANNTSGGNETVVLSVLLFEVG